MTVFGEIPSLGLVGDITIFVLAWWVVFFTVLPWRAQPSEKPSQGHERGAPAKTYMGYKMAITTIIAIGLWLCMRVFLAIDDRA